MLLSEIGKNKTNTGSSFGGGWGLSDLISKNKEEEKEEKNGTIKLSDIGTEKADIKAEQSETTSKQPETKPKEEDKPEVQGNPFLDLNNRIIENYEKLNSMQTELQEKQQSLQQVPEILKPSLMATFEAQRTEYNDMVKQFNEDIKERDRILQEKQQQRLDTERLSGSMGQGERTQEGQLIDKFTTPPEKDTVGGMVGISEPFDLSTVSEPAKKVIQAIGGIQGLRVTEPEIYQESKDVQEKIASQETFESDKLKPAAQSKLTRIAKAHEMLTGTPAKEVFEDIVNRQDEGKKTLPSGFLTGQQDLHLPEEYHEAAKLDAQAQQFSIGGQIGDALQRAAYGVILGNMAYSGIKALYEAGKVSELKTVGQKRIFDVIEKAKNVFEKRGKPGETVTALSQNEMEILRNAFGHWKQTGEYPTSMKVPQVTFLGERGSISLPNLVKSIQSAGKITPDIKNQLNTMTFANKIEAMNQLSKINPDLAANLAVEFSEILKTPEATQAPKDIDKTREQAQQILERQYGKQKAKEYMTGMSDEAIKNIAEKGVQKLKSEAEIGKKQMTEVERVIPKETEEVDRALRETGYEGVYPDTVEPAKFEQPKVTEEERELPKGLTEEYRSIIRDKVPVKTDRDKIENAIGNKQPIPKDMIEKYPDVGKDLERAGYEETYKEMVEPAKVEQPPVSEKTSIGKGIEKPEIGPEEAITPQEKQEIPKPVTEKSSEAPADVEEPQKPFWELEDKEPVLQQETVQKSDIERIEDIKKETEDAVSNIIEDRYQDLKAERDMKMPSDKSVIKDSEGRTIDRYNISQRPQWYQDLTKKLGKKPTNADLREEAIRQLKLEDENFLSLHAQVEAYENIIDTLQDRSGEPVENVAPQINKEVEKLPAEVRRFFQAEEKYPEKAVKEDIKEFEEGVVKYDYKQPATNKQKKDIHQLAYDKKLITKTKSGKISDTRYRNLAKKMTGKRSLNDMNVTEAEEFKAAIEGVVQKQPWQPPVIPDSTKIVEKDFFENLHFTEPGLRKYITPKDYLLRQIGAEQLKSVRDILEADKLKHIEGVNISNWVRDTIKEINKGLPVTQRIKSFVFNKPSEQIARMRDLLDEYIEAPDFLNKKDKKIFTELRDFTRNLLDRTNKVRKRLGLEPINEIRAYIPHFLDELSKQIVQKKYPFPEDVKYWLGRNMPKKISNPTEKERTVRDDLEKTFSKDLGKLLRALAKYDLRDIYLSEPYSILREELKAVEGQIPASVKKEIDDFIKYDIFDYPTELDQLFNTSVKIPTEIVNLLLKPFGRVITNPARDISKITRWLVTRGAIAGRPKLAIRNLGQRMLTMNLYQPKYFLKAQLMPTPKWLREMITNTTFWQLSAQGYEDVPISKITTDKLTMTPYKISHAGSDYVSNVDTAMKAGAYYAEEMIKLSNDTNSNFYKYAQRLSAEKDIPLKDLLWTEEDIKIEAEEAGNLTQWLYYKTGMPRVYRGHLARAVFTLQSWFMNYFGKHVPEAITRTFTGRTSRGKLLRPIDRINWLKGTAIIMGTLWGLKEAFDFAYEKYMLPWAIALNTNIFSPIGQVISGTFNYVTAKTDYAKNQAKWKINSAKKIFIPYYLAIKDLMDWVNGNKSLKETYFYTKPQEEKESFEDIDDLVNKTIGVTTEDQSVDNLVDDILNEEASGTSTDDLVNSIINP